MKPCPPRSMSVNVRPERLAPIAARYELDEDFVMECAVGEEVEMVVSVEPMFLTKTEYFYGFTADSDSKISIVFSESSEIEGEMDAKDHAAKRDGTATSLDRENESTAVKIKLKFE